MDPIDGSERAYAMLVSLQELLANLPTDVPERYVNQYHGALEQLIGVGLEIDDFKIPEAELKRYISRRDDKTGELVYTEDRFVELWLLSAKLNALLRYLSYRAGSGKQERKIGF